MIFFSAVKLKELFEKERDYPWQKPSSCLRCNSCRLWGHGYLTKEALGCFSMVKPSESKKKLSEVSKDLFDLVQQFKGYPETKCRGSQPLQSIGKDDAAGS